MTKKLRPLTPILRHLGACHESLAWLARENHPTFAAAWDACDRIDWLCWLLGRVATHREIVALACDLAEPTLRYVRADEDRSRRAIEVTRAWLRGEATIVYVRAAYTAAYAAANTAAYAAANAANTADAAAYAAAASRAESLATIRRHFPAAEVERRLAAIEVSR